MNIWLLWLLIVVIPGINGLLNTINIAIFVIACIVLLCAGLLIMFDSISNTDDLIKKIKKFKYAAVIWFISCVFVGLLPDKEQITYLVGGYFVTNIEDINKLPPNLIKSANQFLENYISDDKEKPE